MYFSKRNILEVFYLLNKVQQTVSLSPIIVEFVMGELLKSNLVKQKSSMSLCFPSTKHGNFLKSYERLECGFQLKDAESKMGQSPLHLFSIIETESSSSQSQPELSETWGS